ncbi:hypothetical protein ARMGADRAFT_1136608 [Armillaria gallica]|uniref:Uncharacterized protein n=1 Tax=Armillaria gallica TaxID=47427 RepID=A0A2H3D5P5_ARMGA|nr:hypothetical protein ARMGADRAFT_1136608 [Armillaria gallica]
MASYPSESSLQNRGAILKATSFESLLYGIHATLVVFTIWTVVVRDKGRSCLVRCGLVIVMYLIATSPLAIRSVFIEGVRNEETQETIYIYTPGWMLLSSTAFMLNILLTNCMVIWQYWFFCGRGWMFIVIPGLCTIVGTRFGLYKVTITPPSGNACTAQIDWMLPYYSMSLAVTMLCALVILGRIVNGPRIGRRTRRIWIGVIVESSLLFVAGPIILLVIYITSDMSTSCPLLAVTMSTGLVPILAIARVPSDATMQESPPLVPFEVRDSVP